MHHATAHHHHGHAVAFMVIMRLQHYMNMSFDASSIGIISQTMQLAVILQVILHIMIGIRRNLRHGVGIGKRIFSERAQRWNVKVY